MSYKREDYDPIYKMAMDIIDNEWLAVGKTREELNQERQIGDLVDRLMATGKSLDEIDAMWKDKTNAEILEEYAPVLSTH